MERENNHEWKIPWKGMIIALLVSAAALAVIFCQISSPRDILKELSAYPLTYFFSALFFVLAAWIVDGQRIGALARLLGQEIPWWRLAILLGAANFLTLVTPFAGGGGALILYYLYRRGLRSPQAAAVVLGGGLAGQSALALLGFTTSAALRSVPADLAPVFSAVKFGALVYLFILAALQTAIIKSDRFSGGVPEDGTANLVQRLAGRVRGTYEFLIAKRRSPTLLRCHCHLLLCGLLLRHLFATQRVWHLLSLAAICHRGPLWCGARVFTHTWGSRPFRGDLLGCSGRRSGAGSARKLHRPLADRRLLYPHLIRRYHLRPDGYALGSEE